MNVVDRQLMRDMRDMRDMREAVSTDPYFILHFLHLLPKCLKKKIKKGAG